MGLVGFRQGLYGVPISRGGQPSPQTANRPTDLKTSRTVLGCATGTNNYTTGSWAAGTSACRSHQGCRKNLQSAQRARKESRLGKSSVYKKPPGRRPMTVYANTSSQSPGWNKGALFPAPRTAWCPSSPPGRNVPRRAATACNTERAMCWP